MARGMVNGEPIVSQANSEDFEKGYERTFGDRKAERGRWVWDCEQGKLVPADEYKPPERAIDAPVLAGRFYENTMATDGTDISSRAKRKAWMKANELVDTSDCKTMWDKARQERLKVRAGDHDHKERRETIGRALHELRSKRR